MSNSGPKKAKTTDVKDKEDEIAYIGFNKIEDNLYLGSCRVAIDLHTLRKVKIKRVLSVIDRSIEDKDKDIIYKQIYAFDNTKQDLLYHFPETNKFISEGQKNGQRVFVHCMAGISRSATIVIAFIMNKYRMPFSEALNLVYQKRRVVNPNHGFQQQLELYQEMDYKLNANNTKFRLYLFQKTQLHSNCSFNMSIDNLNFYFGKLSIVEEMADSLSLGQFYQCVKCSQQLFGEIHVIRNACMDSGVNQCNSVFIEPQKWMRELYTTTGFSNLGEKSINCPNHPKCNEVIAKFNLHFEPFSCECPIHTGIECLYFKLVNHKFKKAIHK